MEKESENPAINPKTSKKQREYYEAKHFSITDFKKIIPPQLVPTKRFSYIIGTIFILVIIIGIFNFPLGSMMAGNLKVKFAVGFPMDFFVIDLQNTEEMPIKFLGLIVDLIIYFVVAYAIDVALAVFLSSSFYSDIVKSKATAKPEVYKVKSS